MSTLSLTRSARRLCACCIPLAAHHQQKGATREGGRSPRCDMVLRQRPRPLCRATWLVVALVVAILCAAAGAVRTGSGGATAANGRPARGLSASSSGGRSDSGRSSSPSSSETLVCPGTPSLNNNQECDDINNNEYCG